MKKIAIFVMSLMMVLPIVGCKKNTQQVTNDPNIVAKVGDATITKAQLEEQMAKSMKRYYALGKQGHPAMEERIKSNILKRMTDNLMFEQKAKKLGLTIDEKIVNQRFEDQKARFGNEKAYKEYLHRTNNSEADLLADIRFSMTREQVIEAIGGKVEISEADVKAYYDANSDRYIEPEEVHARHILVRVDTEKFINRDAMKDLSAEDQEKMKAEAKQKAQKAAMEKIKDIELLVRAEGADFEAIAKEKSEGPTAPKGGDLGFFSRKRMVKEFSDVAFALRPGEISQIVETRYGLHLIQVVERKDAVQKSFDSVKDGIRTSMENRQRGENRRNVVHQLREEFKPQILIDIKDISTSEGENGAINKQFLREHHRTMNPNGRHVKGNMNNAVPVQPVQQ